MSGSSYTVDEINNYSEITLHCITGTTIVLSTTQVNRNSILTIKNISDYNVLITTEGSEKIDGIDSQTILKYDSISMYPFDNSWWIK